VVVFLDARHLEVGDLENLARLTAPLIVIALDRQGDEATTARAGSQRVDTSDALIRALRAALAASGPALLVTGTV
jgi:hypothetical protein